MILLPFSHSDSPTDMSRPIRIEFPGAHYLVTSTGLDGGPERGEAGETAEVFRDNDDKGVFLNAIEMVVQRFGWNVHAYVLMSDHYHLIVDVPKANLSKGMRQLNGVYTQHFNRRHGLEGPLFLGRFKSVLFEPETYLLPLVRYVALSPVRERVTTSPDKYRWSSHRSTAGFVRRPVFLRADVLLGQFGVRESSNQRRYRQFVKEGVGLPSPLDERVGQVLLGSGAFLKEHAPRLTGGRGAKRGPRRAGRKRTLGSIFKNVEDGSRVERNGLIRAAHIDHGYTLMEIGEHLGLHYTTVSKVINS